MRNVDILANYEKEIGVIDRIDKPNTEDSLHWLHQAIDKFVKLRFNGDFVHGTGVEQTEKRRSDLYRLFITSQLKCNLVKATNQYAKYEVVYPTDFLYELNENVTIASVDDDSNTYFTSVFECTKDSFMYRINNSLTDFHYNFGKARPIRVRTNNGCELYTDGKYTINEYTLGYIKKPRKINLQTTEEAMSEYKDFDDSTLYEIIKMAAQMYLENTKNERYKTITEEVLTQE